MRVMGIDPGGTTGWAIIGDDNGEPELEDSGQVNGEDIVDQGLDMNVGGMYEFDRAQCLALMAIVMEWRPDLIAVEDFILRPTGNAQRAGLTPIRLIAMLEVWLFEVMPETEDWWEPDLVYQTASLAKTTITDDRLKRAGWWVKGMPHARDAVRHAALGYRRSN